MNHEEFLASVEKKKQLERLVSGYSASFIPQDSEKSKQALLAHFKKLSAELAYEVFSEAFRKQTLVEDRLAVLEAVGASGWALQYASAALRADREIAAKALATSYVLDLVGPEIQDDKPLVLACVAVVGRSLAGASDRLKGDREVVRAAVIQKPSSLRFASDVLRSDKSLILEAMKHEDMFDAPTLYYASPALWHDPQLLHATGVNEELKQQRIERMSAVR